MSTNFNGVRNKQDIPYDYQNQVKQGSDIRIGNALSNGNVGDSQGDGLYYEEDSSNYVLDRKGREADVKNLAENAGIKAEDIYSFIENALGYTKEELLNLDQNVYDEVIVGIVGNIFDFQDYLNCKTYQDKINYLHRMQNVTKGLLASGVEFGELNAHFCEFEDAGLLKILQREFEELGKYKDIQEAEQELGQAKIAEYIQALYDSSRVTNENSKNRLSAHLFLNTSIDESKVLREDYIAKIKDEDKKWELIIQEVKALEYDKDKYDKYLQDLYDICDKYDLDRDKHVPMLMKLKDISDTYDMKSEDFYGTIVKSANLDENEHDNKKLDFIQIGAAVATNKSSKDSIENILAIANKNGVSTEDILNEIAEIQKEYSYFSIDIDALDEITDGAFSRIMEEHGVDLSSFNTPSDGSTASSASSDYGYKQSSTQEACWAMQTALDNKIQNLYNQENEEEYTLVENNDKKDRDEEISPYIKYSAIEKLSVSEIYEGLAKKYIKIGDVIDKYNELSQTAKDFINKLVEVMSPGQQNYFLLVPHQ